MNKSFPLIYRSAYSKWFIPGSIMLKINKAAPYIGYFGFGLSTLSSISSSSLLKPRDKNFQSWNYTFGDISFGSLSLYLGGFGGFGVGIGWSFYLKPTLKGERMWTLPNDKSGIGFISVP